MRAIVDGLKLASLGLWDSSNKGSIRLKGGHCYF
ncbi:hypothetical protein LINGRAHAP2_LOCUS35322 [Linum grandiflorum]